MSTATSSANAMHRAATPAAAPQRTVARTNEPARELRMGTEEAAVLRLDLSGLPLPKVGGLEVDGLKPSFFERLFGKR
jgi:hypothetical protein